MFGTKATTVAFSKGKMEHEEARIKRPAMEISSGILSPAARMAAMAPMIVADIDDLNNHKIT